MNSATTAHLPNADQLLGLYHVSPADLDHIRALGEIVLPRLDEFIESFYVWMRTLPEFDQFFSSPEKLNRVKHLQRIYWKDFFRGEVNETYVSKRREVGEAHARIGLSLPAYFAAMNHSLDLLDGMIPSAGIAGTPTGTLIAALTRLMHLDTAVVVETFALHTNRIIAEQHEALMEMSTPVTELWEDILMIPLVGIIDSKRAQDIMIAVLTKIAETHSRALILDISGVAIVDTAVANHLIKITKATRLMGCNCTISGLSPAIAQTIVELGIDVGEVRTTATLKDALIDAFRATGVELRKST